MARPCPFPCPVALLGAPLLVAALAAISAGPARAEGEGWQDRRTWDWGQHRTSLVEEEPAGPAAAPPIFHEPWDYPGAPVRFAGEPAFG